MQLSFQHVRVGFNHVVHRCVYTYPCELVLRIYVCVCMDYVLSVYAHTNGRSRYLPYVSSFMHVDEVLRKQPMYVVRMYIYGGVCVCPCICIKYSADTCHMYCFFLSCVCRRSPKEALRHGSICVFKLTTTLTREHMYVRMYVYIFMYIYTCMVSTLR